MPKPRTILVADDDVLVRLGLSDYLRACGFKVIEAAGGLEAKTILQKGPDVDILLADAQLAGDDGGFALAQWVRRYRRNVSVILTGSLTSKAEAALRICDHPSEPDSAETLLRRIQGARVRKRVAGQTGRKKTS